jgi:hypothetical protein
MGFALCLCNTKAKLAIKQNDKQEFDEEIKNGENSVQIPTMVFKTWMFRYWIALCFDTSKRSR